MTKLRVLVLYFPDYMDNSNEWGALRGLSVSWMRIREPPTSLSQMSIFLAPSLIFFDGKDEIRFRFRSATDLQAE